MSTSVKVPIKESDLDFYMTFESFNKFMSTQNDRILKLSVDFFKKHNLILYLSFNKSFINIS